MGGYRSAVEVPYDWHVSLVSTVMQLLEPIDLNLKIVITCEPRDKGLVEAICHPQTHESLSFHTEVLGDSGYQG